MTTHEQTTFGQLKIGDWFTMSHLHNLYMMKLSHVIAIVRSAEPKTFGGYNPGSHWNTVDERGNLWNWEDSRIVIPIGRLD